MLQLTGDEELRFYNKRAVCGQCILWRGKPDKKGYGRFLVGKSSQLVHHIAFILHNKREPNSYLQHSCKNKLCVNPHHIFEGKNEGRPKN